MDWEGLREKTLAQVGTSILTEGTGTVGGFVGAAFIGRQIENIAKPGVTAGSSGTDKAIAAAANNLPKAVIWYLTRNWAGGAGGGAISEAKADARKALAGSIVFDILMRLGNNGVNPATANLFGWQVLGNGASNGNASADMQADVQRLIGENSALRAELNKAMQRAANAGLQPYPPGQAERQRKYGFTEAEAALQKPRAPRYGFMEGPDQKAENAASIHGML